MDLITAVGEKNLYDTKQTEESINNILQGYTNEEIEDLKRFSCETPKNDKGYKAKIDELTQNMRHMRGGLDGKK